MGFVDWLLYVAILFLSMAYGFFIGKYADKMSLFFQFLILFAYAVLVSISFVALIARVRLRERKQTLKEIMSHLLPYTIEFINKEEKSKIKKEILDE